MANNSDLPCDGDGRCMICKATPAEEFKITCKTCVTPWHLDCLSSRPKTHADAAQWECPDCSSLVSSHAPPSTVGSGSEPSDTLVAAIRAIESDASLTDQEKAKKRQQLLSGKGSEECENEKSGGEKKDVASGSGSGSGGGDNDVLKLLSGSFNCSFCMQLPERPVTTPCGHNFCLKCFEKWVGQGKRTCAICRTAIPSKMASNPRINSSLVTAIRMAKMTKSNTTSGPPKTYYSVLNQNKPDKAYTTERAKKTGKANACSGKIFVTVAPDHFGPITAENDPLRNMGVQVGETWEDRMECRQWGAHLPHVAGICGQSEYGAQSVALSGGYEDDEDHGEWFLYTGSGGRDLSGNKRTNKTQSFDQKFDKSNEALRVSCKKGYPVRVVRSHKEKRSAYAPENGVRYDGVYRIEKCWRKPGMQGPKVCRYLFVRCDNDPAPWTSDETGDRPRPLPVIKELKEATDVTERKSPPSWDYDEEKASWLWKIPPPESKKRADTGEVGEGQPTRIVRRKTAMMSVSERLLKEFCCLICHKVMNLPLTTPCAHNFCKSCLQDTFAGQTFIKERNCEGRRSLRSQKNVMKCPSCTNDISEYLQNPQVNRELMSVIESLQRQTKEAEENASAEEEMLNAAEKTDDIKEEEKDEKLESEVKDLNPEAGETSDSANEDVKESEKIEVVAQPSPNCKSPKANKKGKADVTDNDADNDINAASPKPEVTESKVEKVVEVAKKGKKTRKQTKIVEDVKESEKIEVVAKPSADVTDNDVNAADNDIKAASPKPEVTESKDEKVVEVAKEGRKTRKQTKIVEDVKESEKIEVVAKPSPNCKSPKGIKKRKADVTDNDVKAADNDIEAANPKPEVTESKDEKVVEVAKEGKKTRQQTKIVENVKESEKIIVAAKPSANCKSPKGNKKRKADVTDNDVNAADNVPEVEVTESKDEKVVEVAKERKKTKKQKKNVDEKCSSPASPGAKTRSMKA